MTAEGKITTANLERDTVLISPTATGWEPATRKTDAVTAKVHKVDKLATHAAFGRRATSRYKVTLAIDGATVEMVEITAVPAQTWWLANSKKKGA